MAFHRAWSRLRDEILDEIGLWSNRIDALIEDLYPSILTVGNAGASTSPATSGRIWSTPEVAIGGPLENVKVKTLVGGTGRILVQKIMGASLVVLARWDVTTTGGVEDEFGSETFGTFFVPPGAVVSFERITAGTLMYDGGGVSYYLEAGVDTSVGAANPFTAVAATVSLSATLRYEPVDASDRAADQRLTFESQTFAGTSASAAWALTGWTWSNGLTATAAGWDKQALYSAPSCLANKVVRAGLRLSATSDQVGIIFNCAKTELGGAAAIVNGASGALELYAVDVNGTATLGASVALPSGFLATGVDYVVEARRERMTWTISVTNRATLATYSLTRVYTQTSAAADSARMHGAPGLVCLAGTPTITDFDYFAPVCSQPWALIAANSIGEGTAVKLNSTDWKNAWTYALDDARGRRDVVIGARGGDESTSFIQRMATDLSAWRARYFIWAIGSNDGSQALWRTNTRAVLALAEARGMEPILCTFPPRPAIQSKIDAQNDDVISGYFGRYRFIDFAKALSVDGDRVTQNTALFNSDFIHPTAAGEVAMWLQLQIDAPYLLDGARDDFFPGKLVPEWWKTVSGMPRLRLNGTGTIRIDARDAAGAITVGAYPTTALTGAVDLPEYPYFGEAAVAARVSVTGNVIAEIF